MKKISSLLALICFCSLLFSQTKDTELWKFNNSNSLQLELGGHGLFYSINFEKIILNKHRFKTAVQTGISYYPASSGIRDLWLPIVINEMLSFENHHIEMGLGIVLIHEAFRDLENNPIEWYWSEVLTGRVGYRYQKPDGHFILRAGFTPFLELIKFKPIDFESDFHPSAGLSFGYSL